MKLRSILALVALLTLTVAPAFAAPGTCAPTSDAAFAASLAEAPEATQGLETLLVEPQAMGWTCEEICEWEQDDCYLNRCGQFGSSSCYDACDDQYQDCLSNCP